MRFTNDSGQVEAFSRERRALVFQSGAVMQLTIGLACPVDIPNKTVALNLCLQANFALPTNASEFNYLYQQQQRRDVSRLQLGSGYERLEDMLGGEHCLLRSICEAAAEPLDRRRGILEELLHLLLTIVLLFGLALFFLLVSGNRYPRSLVYPNGGTFKLVVGVGIPIKIPNKTLSMSLNFQFQYSQLTNISEVTQYFPEVVRGRALHHLVDRAATYRSMQTAMDRRGLDGRPCLLRAVCETAETPLHHDGLFGEMLHMLLTPKLDVRGDSSLSEYQDAQNAGENGADCRALFPACPMGEGLLDFLTVVESEQFSFLEM
ncbi:uncharacterized protein [Anabrus simplex]|uniref:uncharacterized protein n=1 Tax=Anabrus simplex TaxID=316456 RepID=UPI0035A2C272